MNEEEEFSPFGGFGSGCDIHGEEYLRECTMCGIEFCSACFPQSTLCSDCAAQGALDGDDEEDVPTAEEKDLLLLEGFNDDEPEESAESVPAPLAAAKPVPTPKKPAKTSAKPASKKAQKTKPVKSARAAAKVKPRKSALRPAKAKTKPKTNPRKPAKATPKKAKAKKKR